MAPLLLDGPALCLGAAQGIAFDDLLALPLFLAIALLERLLRDLAVGLVALHLLAAQLVLALVDRPTVLGIALSLLATDRLARAFLPLPGEALFGVAPGIALLQPLLVGPTLVGLALCLLALRLLAALHCLALLALRRLRLLGLRTLRRPLEIALRLRTLLGAFGPRLWRALALLLLLAGLAVVVVVIVLLREHRGSAAGGEQDAKHR